MPEVERLSFVASPTFDPDEIQLDKITYLNISSESGKPSLKGLEKYANTIKGIQLIGNFANHTEVISSFKNLVTLAFYGIDLKNLDFLKGLPLKSFTSRGTGIKDFTALGEIKTLTYINIRDSRIDSVDFIGKLPNLELLCLWWFTNITSLPNFDEMKQLKYIEVFKCKRLLDIESVKRLGERCGIRIWGCELLPRAEGLGYSNKTSHQYFNAF